MGVGARALSGRTAGAWPWAGCRSGGGCTPLAQGGEHTHVCEWEAGVRVHGRGGGVNGSVGGEFGRWLARLGREEWQGVCRS